MRQIAALLLLAAFGCTSRPDALAPPPAGAAGGAAAGTGGARGSGAPAVADALPGPAPPPEPAADDRPGPSAFHRLNPFELDNTLRDLFGPGTMLAAQMVVPPHGDLGAGFIDGGGGVGEAELRAYHSLAEAAASAAAKQLPTFLPCPTIPTAPEQQEICAGQFITQFGLRAYRRPVSDAESAALLQLYRTLRGPEGGADFPGAIRLLITAMLQSPYFLYRWETVGGPTRDGPLIQLGSYEMASRLSYALTASMPDPDLFAAAAAGALGRPDQIESQARRLLASPRAADAIGDFYRQTLNTGFLPNLDKDTALGFSPALGQSMLNETDGFLQRLFVGPAARARLDDLLTATATVVDPALARLYGVPAATLPATGAVTLDPGQRAGIFTQASFLTANATSSEGGIVARGLTVFERLLCRELPPPPANVDVAPLPPPQGLSRRERFEMFVANPCTNGCHDIYPLGWSFENFDAVGRYSTIEPGIARPIDASGSITLPSGELKFKDAVDMMKQLPARPEVRACMARQWFRYLLRRREGPGDAASLATAEKTFAASAFDLRELIVALSKTRAFTHRSPSAGEVLP